MPLSVVVAPPASHGATSRCQASVRHQVTTGHQATAKPPGTALEGNGSGRYVVQLGTFPDHANEIKARTELAVDLSDILRHDNRPLTIVASEKDGLLRVVFAQAFSTPEAAAALCAGLQARSLACSVTAVWPVPGRDPHGRRVAEAMAPTPRSYSPPVIL